MLIIGAAALIVFGPDQLPKVARRAGQVIREVQNTSQTFVREMERAADEGESRWEPAPSVVEPPAEPHPAAPHYERVPQEARPAEHTMGEHGHAVSAHEDVPRDASRGGPL